MLINKKMKEKTKKHLKVLGIVSVVFGCVFGLSLNAIDHQAIRVNADALNESETTMTIDINNKENNITFLDKDIMLRADIEFLGIGNNFRYAYDFTSKSVLQFANWLLTLTNSTAYETLILKQNDLRENFSIYYLGKIYDFSYIVSNGPTLVSQRTFYFLTKQQYLSNNYDMVNFDGLQINMSTLNMGDADFELYYYCDYWTYSGLSSNVSIVVDLFNNVGEFSYYIPPYLTLDIDDSFNFYFDLINYASGNKIIGAQKNNNGFNFIGTAFNDIQNQGLNSKGDKYIVEVVGVNSTISLGQNVWSYSPYYSFEFTLFHINQLTFNSFLFLQKYCIPSWAGEFTSEMYFNERKLYKFGDIFHVFRGEHEQGDWTSIAIPYLNDYVYGTFENFTFEYGGKYYDKINIRAPLTYSYLNNGQYEWYIRAGNQFIQNNDIIVTLKMIEDSFQSTGQYIYSSGQALTYKGLYTEQIYNFMVLFGFVDSNIGPTIGITGSGGTFTDIFDMFGSAFNGVYNAFSVYVLPGVTLWALCMIPLVAVIILFIVKLFKR